MLESTHFLSEFGFLVLTAVSFIHSGTPVFLLVAFFRILRGFYLFLFFIFRINGSFFPIRVSYFVIENIFEVGVTPKAVATAALLWFFVPRFNFFEFSSYFFRVFNYTCVSASTLPLNVTCSLKLRKSVVLMIDRLTLPFKLFCLKFVLLLFDLLFDVSLALCIVNFKMHVKIVEVIKQDVAI